MEMRLHKKKLEGDADGRKFHDRICTMLAAVSTMDWEAKEKQTRRIKQGKNLS